MKSSINFQTFVYTKNNLFYRRLYILITDGSYRSIKTLKILNSSQTAHKTTNSNLILIQKNMKIFIKIVLRLLSKGLSLDTFLIR